MQFAVQVPLNSLSFGQVSFNLLYEFYKLGLNPHIFKASDHQIDFSAYDFEQDFTSWIIKNHNEALLKHNRNIPCIRLWHINDSLRTYSNRQILLTFHETDQLTPIEANILKNSEVCVTSKYTQDVFADAGVSSSIVHLGFDSNHFKILDKKYFDDGRITFNLCGKYEKRKHHTKIVKTWIKKFGKDKRYSLQCALHNPFYQDPAELKGVFSNMLDGKPVFNVTFLTSMPKNSTYNDFLNSSVIVEPNNKIEVYDGKFFAKGVPFNQGNIFDFSEDEFIAGCEEAIKRVESDRVNHEGLKLQEKFKYSDTASKLLSMI